VFGKDVFDHIDVRLRCEPGVGLCSIKVPQPRITLPSRESRQKSSDFSATCFNRRINIGVPNNISRVSARRINGNCVPAIASKGVHKSSIEPTNSALRAMAASRTLRSRVEVFCPWFTTDLYRMKQNHSLDSASLSAACQLVTRIQERAMKTRQPAARFRPPNPIDDQVFAASVEAPPTQDKEN